MRAMARPPSSPKSSPATPKRVTTGRPTPNGTLQHTIITTLPPFNQKPMSTNNTARLDPRTDVPPFSHIRVPLVSAAYRLAAGAPHIALQPEAPILEIQCPLSFSAK
jgi:hypothetical protein